MKKITIIWCGIALLIVSCNNGSKEKNNELSNDVAAIKQDYKSKDISANGNVSFAVTDSAGANNEMLLQSGAPKSIPDWNKKIIKTANLEIELKDYKVFDTYIHQNTKNYGAYIATEQQYETELSLSNSIAIKVPVEKFEQMVNDIAGKGDKVLTKQIASEDVTGEFVDTKARIETRKMLRNKYNEFMNRAKNMEEALAVQSEINSITEEIESASGRVQYINAEAAYSTINLKYTQPFAGAKPATEDNGFFAKAGYAFKQGWSFIVSALVAIISVWPLLIAGILVFIFYKRNKKQIKTA